jgi:methyl-accepting chemotaxis protein
LTDVGAWHGHIPFAFALVEMTVPQTIVELGVHKGDSYCAFCEAVALLGNQARCYAVDNWKGDPHSGYYGDEVYQEFKAYHDARYRSFSKLVRANFDDAVCLFEDGSIDLLHIDGSHTYSAVKGDFETWLSKLSRRGVVLLHDTLGRERDFGVWRLWEELTQSYPSLHFPHSHGLGVLGVGRELPQALIALFQASPMEQQKIQLVFERLGRAIALTDGTRDRLEAELKMALEARQAEIDQTRTINDGLVAEIERSRNEIRSLADEVEQARKAHAERDHQEIEIRQRLAEKESSLAQALEINRALLIETEEFRGKIQALVNEVENARKAHAERDRLETQLREALAARDEEMVQARKTIHQLVEEIDHARDNIQKLTDQVEEARKAHGERDRLEGELKEALAAREAEISQARNTIDQLVGEIDQARDNIHDLTAQVEKARKAHAERDRVEAELRHTVEVREAEMIRARQTIDQLVADCDQVRRDNQSLRDQTEEARKAQQERDHVEAELRQALRTQHERIGELTAQLQTLTHDLKFIRESWQYRLLHPLEGYRRAKV